MKAKLRSRRQKIERPRLVVGVIVASMLVIALIVGIIGGYLFNWAWTGVGQKTLWDWLNLLGVLAIPVMVGIGAAWFTAQQGKVSDAENKDNQRETALKSTSIKCQNFSLKSIYESQSTGYEVREIARARTLTLLPRLDGKRKKHVLQFLHESKLIARDNIIFHLEGADLSNADLQWANLSNDDLRKVNLSTANLSEANLGGSHLFFVNLNGANMVEANLCEADLTEANLSKANLSGASLYIANLSEPTSAEPT
jgi:hypothetical protein